MFDLNNLRFSLFSFPILLILGAIFLFLGLTAQLGLYKNWYWRKQNLVYAYIPIGVLCIVANYETSINEYFGSRTPFILIVSTFLVISFLFMNFQSVQIKPKWIKQIEKEPIIVQEAMREEVLSSKIDWRKNVQNKETITKWARSLKRKASFSPKGKKNKKKKS